MRWGGAWGRGVVVVACLFFGACAPRQDGGYVKLAIKLPTQTYQLDNGLAVLLHADHKVPYVHVLVRYNVGNKDDPPGRAGLAHLYEHLMFAAAKHLPPDEYLGTLDRSGATDFNGVTSRDTTTYFETVPTASLEIALFLEAERMGFAPAAVTTAQFDRERHIVREEYRQQTLDRPYGLVHWFATQALYPTDHPYFPGTQEEANAVDAITEAEVREFGATYYVPNDATLALAGDFDEEKIRPLIAKYFAGIPGGAKAPSVRHIVRPTSPRIHEVHAVANVDDERVVLAWAMPAYDDDGYREHVVAASLLGGYTGGRLRKKDDPLSKTGASYGVEPGALSSEFVIVMTAGPGSLDDLVGAFEGTQRHLRDADRLDSWGDEKSQILVNELFRIESLDSRAEMLLDYERRMGMVDGAMTDMLAYQGIELGRVQRAMSETFSLSQAAIVYVRKDPKAPVSGKVVP